MTDKGITKKLSRNIWFQCFLQPSAFAYLDFAFVNFDSIHNEVFSSFIFVPQAPVFAIRDFIWYYSLVVSFSEAKMIPLCTHFCREAIRSSLLTLTDTCSVFMYFIIKYCSFCLSSQIISLPLFFWIIAVGKDCHESTVVLSTVPISAYSLISALLITNFILKSFSLINHHLRKKEKIYFPKR